MTKVALARLVAIIGVLLSLSRPAAAQEAVLTGTITDSTGSVLPGVTVVAVHEATGNMFETVTDDRGRYRMPVRVGVYKITTQLSGFATVTRQGVEVLVGQEAVTNFQMAPSAVQESITVTGETPLVNTTQSRSSGAIDPRQLQELPVNGRNWQDLTLLSP